ncbi:hypothetical protein DAPPUDRAFT_260353 [Daphnia pulex]|uniref:Uncharacterized protein n=1 Tax=Daphnia pulex TaxID=6669 RepID=E9HJ05_DAPPU|nr:hypothetical protein DAPPUDRAFT_260353 [Daphnia pulex]|eukprot:EFX68231.1 hypothetical protein DAPPUDRAFT_260353 [Daphnia pulex]
MKNIADEVKEWEKKKIQFDQGKDFGVMLLVSIGRIRAQEFKKKTSLLGRSPITKNQQLCPPLFLAARL